MASKSRQPTEGQLSFDGHEVPPATGVDVTRRRNALARTLTPEYLGLNPGDFMDVTVPQVEAVAASALRADIIDVRPDIDKNPNVASYYSPTLHRNVFIALSPQFATTLPRFVRATASQAQVKSAAKTDRQQVADLARARRAPAHVLETKLPGVRGLAQQATQQRELARKFMVASSGRNVGLSLFGDEIAMRLRFAELDESALKPMIRAYCEQRELSADQRTKVDKAIKVSTVLGPKHTAHFHDLMKLTFEYYGHVQELCDQRVKAMEREIGKRLVGH